ncbi:hypothetical protein [Aestuariicoccus sp. MJ-SS9]|uniref:hypothetical protein n=1 Tax=Aestuariicoccus sp. MJ-SS9 TaxID=3079855 RepID=UPI00290F35D6|nr:hypothetical protein [Aestuariicoccus sp. MJ-SS9]MDU8911132.1 hypothetical protein [Aestuariicoccus sp. MJ-SS9]
MPHYEYKVVPAPAKGRKAKGVKGAEGRFAFAVEQLLNDMAAEGWEFQRAETLPSEERAGLTKFVTTPRSLLVFRRARADDLSAFQPRMLTAPDAQPPQNGEDADEERGTDGGPGIALRLRAESLHRPE